MKREITMRFILVYLGMLVLTALIVGKSLYLQFIEGDRLKAQARDVTKKALEIKPNRGDICAEDGRILATSLPYYSLYFDATVARNDDFEKNVDSLAISLSAFFKDMGSTHYRKLLQNARKHKKRYVQINRRKVSFLELREIKKFPLFRLGRNRGGLIEEMISERIQPHVNLAGRTIGYLSESDDGSFEGRVGLEKSFENELRGIPGRSVIQMMSGLWVPVTVEEPEDGYDVITTINVDFQDIVQNALLRQLEKFEAEQGSAILMEVKTGDIKAIANLKRNKNGKYLEQLNNAIGTAGEPGSVMKAATMIALLEDGFYDITDTVDFEGKGVYRFYDRTLTESDNKKFGKITVGHVFEVSSNGIAKLADEKYKEDPARFVNRLCGMGLDKKTGIRISGEDNPYIKHPGDKEWSGISLPWMSIGYEIMLTPLQVLCFYNAIANDGQRMQPRLVKEVVKRGESIKAFRPEKVGGRICSRSTLQKMQELLEGVVENGTARNIRTTHYRIAGKTGTARIASGTTGYGNRSYRASFVGYFPADNPLYSCIVVIDRPSLSKGYYASQVSSPVFKEIADKVFSIAYREYGEAPVINEPTLPVSKDGYKEDFYHLYKYLKVALDGKDDVEATDWVLTYSGEGENILVKPRRIQENLVPNVKGMGLRDAVYILENAGLSVEARGEGAVYSQSLQPGELVREGGKILIELR